MLTGWLAQGLRCEPHRGDRAASLRRIAQLAANDVRLNPTPGDVGTVAALVVAVKPQMFREAGPR